jgi:carboxyl-terminal processing protease
MSFSQLRGRLSLLILFLAAGWTLPALNTPSVLADEAVHSQQENWWQEGWSYVRRGRFDLATETFRKAAATPDADQNLRNVSDWLESFEEMQHKREALREKEFNLWVERTETEIVRLRLRPLANAWLKPLVDAWAEEERAALDPQADESEEAAEDLERLDLFYIKRADDAAGVDRLVRGLRAGLARVYYNIDATRWIDVLANARMACRNAADRDAFTSEPWMSSIVKCALEAAAENRDEEKWLEASGIYYELEVIYNEDPRYKQLREDSQTHYRLEMLYSEDEEDDVRSGPHQREDWRKIVRGADPSIVTDAIHRISQSYVRKPDFKKIMARGLEAVLLITHTPALKDTFEGLNDDLMVGMFNDRVQRLLTKLGKDKPLSARKADRNYWRALLKINRSTIRLPEQVLAVEFMEGALRSLDEFSDMIWPYDVSEFRKYTTGKFTGVGIQINAVGKYITVFSPMEDSPAYRAGIRPGDIIVKIEGESAIGIRLDEAVERITGPPGTKVSLTIKRGDEEIDFVLERADILIQSVKGAKRAADGVHWDYMIDPEQHIAYVRLNAFNETTVRDLELALQEIEEQGARGLILDLRFNPGGLLTAAWKVADLLLPANQVIVRTAGRDPGDEWQKKSRSSHTELPLIVLVNGRSASASEIVSGAVKDHKRGLIVGERTFGKGSVQNLIPMADNEAFLKLTTAHYYLPSGRCLQREDGSDEWGVEPDVEVELVPAEVRHVHTVRRNSDIINVPGAAPAEPESESQPEREQDEVFDAQLETALLLMRVKLAGGTDWSFPDRAMAAADKPQDVTKN